MPTKIVEVVITGIVGPKPFPIRLFLIGFLVLSLLIGGIVIKDKLESADVLAAPAQFFPVVYAGYSMNYNADMYDVTNNSNLNLSIDAGSCSINAFDRPAFNPGEDVSLYCPVKPIWGPKIMKGLITLYAIPLSH